MAENIVSVSLKSNLKKVLKASEEQIMIGLASVGEAAEGFAKQECPTDTGRLKGSITYATAISQGEPEPVDESKADDWRVKAKPEDFSVYIGTNVEYAIFVEYNTRAYHKSGNAHFLRNAATKHGSDYKKILKGALSK